MRLLADRDLVAQIQNDPPLISGVAEQPPGSSRMSTVQPSSVDLHVGAVYAPPEDREPLGAAPVPLGEYTLHPGQTAVVTTLEVMNLPSDIAAFGFPPTALSGRAILMTNPGHVDPGYQGHLSFTLINMGREPFTVSAGRGGVGPTPVVTLLFVKLSEPVEQDYHQRRNPGTETAQTPRTIGANVSSGPSSEDLHRLGRDFLDVTERAREAAERVIDREDIKIRHEDIKIRHEDIKIRRRQIWVPLLAAFVAAGLGFGGSVLKSHNDIKDLEARITRVSAELQIDDRLDSLEDIVREAHGTPNTPSQ